MPHTDVTPVNTAELSPSLDIPEGFVYLRVKRIDMDIYYCVKKSAKLTIIKYLFCEKFGIDISSTRIMFKGILIKYTDTPETLGLVNNDTILLCVCDRLDILSKFKKPNV